jgi:tetratricopeptide (TPR) repeat protein
MSQLRTSVAYSQLGGQATLSELIDFARSYPDSPEAEQVRGVLAASFLSDAQGLIRAQDYRGALGRLTLAAEWGGDGFALETRTRAYVLLGASTAAQGNINRAIEAYEEAVKLGADEHRPLASLYLRQARESLSRGLLIQSVQQAERALRHSPSLHMEVASLRREHEPLLMRRLQAGQAVESIGYALLVTGEGTRSILEQYIVSQPVGLVGPLFAQLSESEPPTDPDAALFLPRVIREVHSRLAQSVDRHLSQNLDALIGSNVVLGTSQSGPLRDSARTDVERFLEFAGNIGSDLIGTDLLDQQQLLEALLRGQRPASTSLPRALRAQLLLMGLDSVHEVRSRLRTDTTAMVAAFIGRADLPVDLLDWTLLVEQSRTIIGGEVTLSSGATTRVSVENTREGAVNIRINVGDDSAGLTDPQTSDALTVLFGTARLFKSVEPELTGLNVSVVGTNGSRLLTVSLDRRDIDNLAWDIIESETPFSSEHLVFIKHEM